MTAFDWIALGVLAFCGLCAIAALLVAKAGREDERDTSAWWRDTPEQAPVSPDPPPQV